MPKATVPFGEWRPDIALLDNQFASEAENVFPGLNSYKPVPSLLPFAGTALPTPLAGLTAARTTGGEWRIYAGTRTALYSWSHAGWTDVSRTVGGAYNVPSTGELWSFAPFGQYLVAVNIGDTPQVCNVDTGSTFANLGGSPPVAKNVKQIGEFLILSGLSSNERKIQWSAINDITGWTVGVSLSDEQEFPEGGPVQGVTGGEIGYVVQDRCIRTMQFLPGDTTYIFSFSRVMHDRGCISQYGFASVGSTLYFVAEDGFWALSGQQVFPIGQDKINEWWLANSDVSRRNVVQCIAANRPYVIWAYHSNDAVQTYDKIIIYDWSLQKWSHASMNAYVWGLLASISLDLDTTGTEVGDVDLDSAAQSLDSFAYIGGRPLLSAIDQNGYLCALNGPNLQATIETVEAHLNPGMRSFVSDAYPLINASEATVATAIRERLQDDVMWNDPIPLEVTGSASILSSSRLHRFRVRVPAADTWTHAQGVMVEQQPDGMA